MFQLGIENNNTIQRVGNNPNNRVIKKTFNPPQARLTRIRLTFYDVYGNLYDFQNQDHGIEFNIELFKMQRRYMMPFMED